MRKKIKEITIFFMIIMLLPAWLYASGNLPSLFPPDQRLIEIIRYSFPTFAAMTYKESHRAYEMLRDFGIPVPSSYNERSLSIADIRTEVIRLCDSILEDIY